MYSDYCSHGRNHTHINNDRSNKSNTNDKELQQ